VLANTIIITVVVVFITIFKASITIFIGIADSVTVAGGRRAILRAVRRILTVV
jgi:hypothetical protein